MGRNAVLLLVLVACGKSAPPAAIVGDKCTRAYDRMEPLFAQSGGKRDRAAELKACRDALAKDPGREIWLDCILQIEGELTPASLKTCEAVDRRAIESKEAPTQVHVLGNRSAGSATP